MNILVPGGAGYIGSHTIKVLLDEGEKVVVLDDLSTGNRDAIDSRALFIQGSCDDRELVTRIIKEQEIDAVMHFAGKIVVSESMVDPHKYYYHNIHQLNELLKIVVDNGVRNFVFSSTASVYGDGGLESYDELSPTAPINPYAQTKLDGEKMIQAYTKAYDLNAVIFRYFNVAGADLNGNNGLSIPKPTHIIPSVVNNTLGLSEQLKIFGDDYPTPDGTCIRDYIHVVDLAEAHYLGLKHAVENNTSLLLNLGSGSGYSVKEVVDAAEKVIEKPVNKAIVERRAGDPARIIANATKAYEVLGWKPKYDLNDMIASHYLWRTLHPEGHKK